MTDIERQILLNQIVMLETLTFLAPVGQSGPRQLLNQRYRETCALVRQHSPNPPKDNHHGHPRSAQNAEVRP